MQRKRSLGANAIEPFEPYIIAIRTCPASRGSPMHPRQLTRCPRPCGHVVWACGHVGIWASSTISSHPDRSWTPFLSWTLHEDQSAVEVRPRIQPLPYRHLTSSIDLLLSPITYLRHRQHHITIPSIRTPAIPTTPPLHYHLLPPHWEASAEYFLRLDALRTMFIITSCI